MIFDEPIHYQYYIKSRHARYYLTWTIAKGAPRAKCLSHTRYLAHGNSRRETEGRIRHQNNRNNEYVILKRNSQSRF